MTDLTDILSRYGADCRPTQIEPLGSAGGLSGAQFWRLATPRGTLALRCWPSEHPTRAGLEFIHAVLRHVSKHGVSILPVPLATADGATFVQNRGRLWELAPWLPGAADYDKAPTPEKLRAAMQALAEFHNAAHDFPVGGDLRVAGKAPAITTRLARLHDLQSGGIQILSRAIDDSIWPELALLARQFVAALPRAVPPAIAKLAPLVDVVFPLQPCIRDIWHDHILFDGDRVTGLIDFGAMQIDTPATDVARLLGSLVGDDRVRWQAAIAAYAGIRPLNENERLAVVALDTSGTILAGCNWIKWIYIEKREFDRTHVIDRFRQIVSKTSL